MVKKGCSKKVTVEPKPKESKRMSPETIWEANVPESGKESTQGHSSRVVLGEFEELPYLLRLGLCEQEGK